MKRIIAICLLLMVTLSMAACGTEDSAKGTATGNKSGEIRIALLQQHQLNAFQTDLSDAAKQTAEELGCNLTTFSADQDVATQIAQMEQCVTEGYDAIIFEPVDPDGLKDAAKAAADKGVVVVNVVSTCSDWEESGISAVSVGDNVKAGENEMQHVADLLGGTGNIAILTGPSASKDALDRLEGYRNILANYPNIREVVAPADCSWDTASAQATVENWLSAYELDAIVSENDSMAVGAGNAAGANSGIIIAGLDGTADGYEAIRDGRITGTVAQDPAVMAANAVKAAASLVKGETLIETTILTDSVWIDRDNIDD